MACLARVFNKPYSAGNPAYIIEGHPTDMQRFATEREATCVFLQQDPDVLHVRFFTPKDELPFCGHGLLAAGHYWMEKNGVDRLTIGTQTGRCTVFRDQKQRVFFAARTFDVIEPHVPLDDILSFLPRERHTIDRTIPSVVATIGSPKLLVPLSRTEDVLHAHIEPNRLIEWSREHQTNGIYLYATDQLHHRTIHARGLNPVAGVAEDAATGVAAGALGKWLHHYHPSVRTLTIEQGHLINNPCEIHVHIVDDAVRIGGNVQFERRHSLGT